MADILHDFVIDVPCERVFEAFTTPQGLDAWWTDKSAGKPVLGSEYSFYFAPEYDWRGRITRVLPGRAIAWSITQADKDWTGTEVGAELEDLGGKTQVRFRHTGWASPNDHFRRSSYCWAMYLRVLKRFLEDGERVAYAERQNA